MDGFFGMCACADDCRALKFILNLRMPIGVSGGMRGERESPLILIALKL